MSELGIRHKVPAGAAGDTHALTPRERLRASRQRLADGSTRLFVLPGYENNPELGGQLVARYRRLGFEELTAAFNRQGDGEVDVVAMNAQFLVDSCEEIMIRESDGTLTPLVDGHKTTYTVDLQTGQSLGTLMGVDNLPTIRDQLVAEFGGNELAVNEHSGDVHRWMVSANAVDAETALGEPAAR
jgi:hypothetical protein